MSSTALNRLSSYKNLSRIWKEHWPQVKPSAPGIDGLTPRQFDDNQSVHLSAIRKKLVDGYTCSKLRAVPVPKKDPDKFRVICIPTLYDRVVQRAVLECVQAKAGKLGIENDVSFGFIKDPDGNKRGVFAARAAAIRHREQRNWVFKADIDSFFDQISREELIDRFNRSFSLKSLLSIVREVINCEIDTSDPRTRRILADNGIRAGRGLRQGMPLSPLLSNFVLRDFDGAFIKHKHDLVRYADDLVAFASSRSECEDIQALTIAELEKLGLRISPSKTSICNPDEAVEFLGMELGRKQDTDKYGLTISSKQIAKIKEQFTNFHDINFVISKNLNISKLLRRLENMKLGYRIAYNAADNRKDFYDLLDIWTQNCLLKIYSSIFGSQAIARLTKNQRLFLMLEQLNELELPKR